MKPVALALALASMLAIAGCGDAGASADFAHRAEEICAEANQGVRALGPEPPILTGAQARWIESLTEIDSTAVRRLRALKPPAEDRRLIAAMLSAFERGLSYGDEIARASRAGDDTAFRSAVFSALTWLDKARATATRYRLEECARLGSVDRTSG